MLRRRSRTGSASAAKPRASCAASPSVERGSEDRAAALSRRRNRATVATLLPPNPTARLASTRRATPCGGYGSCLRRALRAAFACASARRRRLSDRATGRRRDLILGDRARRDCDWSRDVVGVHVASFASTHSASTSATVRPPADERGPASNSAATFCAARLPPRTVRLTCVGFPRLSRPVKTRTSHTPGRFSRIVATRGNLPPKL